MKSDAPKRVKYAGSVIGRKRDTHSALDDAKMSESKVDDYSKKPTRARSNPMRYIGSTCLQAHHD